MIRKCIVAAVLALSAATGASVAVAGPGGSKNEVRVEGVLAAVNLQTAQITITTRRGPVVLTLTPATKIERNDRHATLGAFKIGDRAQARIQNGVVVKFEAVGP